MKILWLEEAKEALKTHDPELVLMWVYAKGLMNGIKQGEDEDE